MALIGVLMNAKGEIFSIFFPIYVVTIMKLPEYYLGFFLAIPAFLHIFQFYFGKLADNVSAEFGTLFGVFIVSSSIIFLPYVSTVPALVILLLVYGIGGSIWNVNAWSLMSRIAEEKKIAGEIIGSYSSISRLGMFISALIGAYLVSILGIVYTLQLFAIMVFFANILTYMIFSPVFYHERKQSFFHKVKKHL